MKATIHITLKNGVLDPQGKAIENALGQLGFGGVEEVRQGKLIEVNMAETAGGCAEDDDEKVGAAAGVVQLLQLLDGTPACTELKVMDCTNSMKYSNHLKSNLGHPMTDPMKSPMKSPMKHPTQHSVQQSLLQDY